MIIKIKTFKESFNFKLEKVKPKDWEELYNLIHESIEMYGYECDLNFIDTSLITDMAWIFSSENFEDFNGNISEWNVSNVINMRGMFYDSKFDGDISGWNVSNVLNMDMMFENSEFTGDINRWDISNMSDMDDIFMGSKLKKQNKLPEWYKQL